MKLNLKRPMIFFDLETTGTDIASDRIVEISVVKVMPDGEQIIRTRRINPEMPIPAEATAVHHITDEDVKDCPTLRQVAKSLREFMVGCDFCGFNSNRFDLPLLAEEFLRAGVEVDFFDKAKYVDVQNIFHKKEERTLVAAYRFYCGKELEAAHSADADTMATYEVLMAQLEKYDIPTDVDGLAEFTSGNLRFADFAGRVAYDAEGKEIFNFGKYKGQLAETVLKNDPGYFGWITQADFPLTTKQAFTRIMLKSKM